MKALFYESALPLIFLLHKRLCGHAFWMPVMEFVNHFFECPSQSISYYFWSLCFVEKLNVLICFVGTLLILPINAIALYLQFCTRKTHPDSFKMMQIMGYSCTLKFVHGLIKIGTFIMFKMDIDGINRGVCKLMNWIDFCCSALQSFSFLAISIQRCLIIYRPGKSYSSRIWLYFFSMISFICIASLVFPDHSEIYNRYIVLPMAYTPYGLCIMNQKLCQSALISTDTNLSAYILSGYFMTVLIALAIQNIDFIMGRRRQDEVDFITQVTTVYLLTSKRVKLTITANTSIRLLFTFKLQLISNAVVLLLYFPWYVNHILITFKTISLNEKYEKFHTFLTTIAYFTHPCLFHIFLCTSGTYRARVKAICRNVVETLGLITHQNHKSHAGASRWSLPTLK